MKEVGMLDYGSVMLFMCEKASGHFRDDSEPLYLHNFRVSRIMSEELGRDDTLAKSVAMLTGLKDYSDVTKVSLVEKFGQVLADLVFTDTLENEIVKLVKIADVVDDLRHMSGLEQLETSTKLLSQRDQLVLRAKELQAIVSHPLLEKEISSYLSRVKT